MKNKKLLLVALILAAITAVTVYQYLEKVKTTARLDTWKRVVVAAKDIPARTQITPDMLKEVDFPADYVHPRAIITQDSALGQVTLAPILTGEFLLTEQLAWPSDPKQGLAFRLAPGKRAVSVAVDEITGVAGLLNPGDRVDVLATININEGGAAGMNKTLTIITVQDVEVLAAGKRMDEIRTDGKTEPVETKTITLAVSTDEIRPLVLASEKGSIRLALRSPADRNRVVLPPYQLTDLPAIQ